MRAAAYMLTGFVICLFGFWLGVKTERDNQRHLARRAKTHAACRTYTSSNGATVTWGPHD